MSFVAGASASIMKTIKEIEAILEGEDLDYSGPKRHALHEKLQDALIKSSRTWYKKGFKRGHMEAYRASVAKGEVPLTLSANVEREFLPNYTSAVPLKSNLSESFVQKVSENVATRGNTSRKSSKRQR
ncbi:hypothetical protein [Geobacter sp. SVR]|uniref:hypothetical protein n=1 Tax=Geobacter sp. SVR TaxID=2495594 RepID=UPI00143F02A5|nr:hypothetical protein [Geobacter sp. SVR]BCS53456.1 hypothetical protein GSVR_17640 [Geobacter sp. SVR]GCF85417.1 hypothetical protein GSbR_20170 [Geobacter sp. SVR]